MTSARARRHRKGAARRTRPNGPCAYLKELRRARPFSCSALRRAQRLGHRTCPIGRPRQQLPK
eukprot:3835492-Lingulodinium_polyedra.AAC.1